MPRHVWEFFLCAGAKIKKVRESWRQIILEITESPIKCPPPVTGVHHPHHITSHHITITSPSLHITITSHHHHIRPHITITSHHHHITWPSYHITSHQTPHHHHITSRSHHHHITSHHHHITSHHHHKWWAAACDNSCEHSWKLEDWSLIDISDFCFCSINGVLQVFVKRGVDEPVFQDRSGESILTEWSFRVLFSSLEFIPTWATWESPQAPPMPMNEKNWTRVCFRCRAPSGKSSKACPKWLCKFTFSYVFISTEVQFG